MEVFLYRYRVHIYRDPLKLGSNLYCCQVSKKRALYSNVEVSDRLALKFPGVVFGRYDDEFRQKETTYTKLRDRANTLMTSCRMVGVGYPCRVNQDEGKITSRNIDACIDRLRTGIEVMQRRCDEYMNLDPCKEAIEDNDSDWEAEQRSVFMQIEKNIEDGRKMRGLEEKEKIRAKAKRVIYWMSVKKCRERLNQPLVKRKPRTSIDLPTPSLYWDLYETKKCDTSFNMLVGVRVFGKELKLSLKAFHSLSSKQIVEDEIIGLYVELLSRWYIVESRKLSSYKKFAIMCSVNFVVRYSFHIFII